MTEGHFHHLGMLDSGSSDDEARLHVLMRRNDFAILNLLRGGADFNQYSGQDSVGAAGLVCPAGSRGWCVVNWGWASLGAGLTRRLTFGGTRAIGKPRRKPKFYLWLSEGNDGDGERERWVIFRHVSLKTSTPKCLFIHFVLSLVKEEGWEQTQQRAAS